MIHIDRKRKDEHGRSIKPPPSWYQKAAVATKTAKKEKGDHKADDRIYADIEVRKALEKLFYDKCAYCESKMTAEQDWNVEHFRPAGRVAERKDHAGYYWLAYSWDNLFPSCTHCNQRRRDMPRWDDPRELPSAGKRDQFPLCDETTRAMSPRNDIYREYTLLIDPCYDDPEWYIGYDPLGQIFAPEENPYGEKTIEVFHLKRRRLRDARREIMEFTIGIVKAIQKAETGAEHGAVSDFKTLLKTAIAENSEYAGAARFIVKNPTTFLK